jgi:hypothetical protein
VWQEVDTHAQLAELTGLLEHLGLDAQGMQKQRSGQPTNATAGNQHLHRWTP